MTKPDNIEIIVFGGGTSGWLTAAYLVNNLQFNAKITLIEDASKGPIGVGEGTQPYTPKFLTQCGITPKMWMKPSNASFKYGVELTGWNDKPYFVDNDVIEHQVISEDFYVSDYFMSKSKEEYFDWYPSYKMAKKNLSQKMTDNLGLWNGVIGAVHFGAYDIINTIKDLILDKITYVDKKIMGIDTDVHGITRLRCEHHTHYQADLYIDCSGFESVLLEKSLKVPFIPYTNWLFNDSAVAIPTEYKDPRQECHPYTKATAMHSGWRWTIPTYHRIGNGYVYSSKYSTPENAESELRDAIGDYATPARHLKMKTGYHKSVAHKNVLGVGLAAGFVEPLEATGITFTTFVVSLATNVLNQYGWNEQSREEINTGFRSMSDEILAFVWAHYHWSSKDDSRYWFDVRKQKISDLPDGARKILNKLLPVPSRFFFYNDTSMFSVCQWFSMLKAGGAYENITNRLTEKQERFGKFYTEMISSKVDLVEKHFPSHYDYLRDWYERGL